MKIYRYLLSLFFCSFIFIQVKAQISTREAPISSEHGLGLSKDFVPIIVMPDIDHIKLLEEDKREEELGLPPRFGFIHSIDLNFLNVGYWNTLDNDDKICRLTIVCPGALSINLLYDKFWLPEGAKFFVYSQKNKKHHIGAFTEINNKGGE